MSDKKFSYMNYTKLIGIILVVIGHSGSKFTNFIYLFHMSLFFFISGYFYKDSYTKNCKSLILRKIKSLYIPFITWELSFLLLHNLFYLVNIYEDKINMKEFINKVIQNLTFGGTEQLLGTFWFLISLFTINILFGTSRYIIIHKYNQSEIKYIIFIVILFYIGINTNFPRLISVSMVSTSIFYIGYLYKKLEDKVIMNPIIAIMSFFVLVINSNKGSISIGA